MTDLASSIKKAPLFEKRFYSASIAWWAFSLTTLVALSLRPIPQIPDLKPFLSEHLVSLLLVAIVAPFVLYLYGSHARLAQTKQDIAILDLQEKKRIIENLRTETSLRESLILKAQDTARQIALSVASDLKNDSHWAADALREAAILGGAISVFGQRIHHFRDEKNAMAVNFFHFLLKRIRHLSTQHNRVLVLLDSGTTILPFFELFGKAAVKDKQSPLGVWTGKTELITNNIPGISELIKHGRSNPTDRFDEIAVRCHVLPGTPLAVYSAIVGDKTVEAIKTCKTPGDYVIGLTTGNFVLVSGQRLRPLARGEGHYEIKHEICSVSDEAYVIASLGKLIKATSPEEFNSDLRFSSSAQSKAMQPYRAVEYPEGSKLKLVTTMRESDKSILREFSKKLLELLYAIPPHAVTHGEEGDPDVSTEPSVEKIPHFLYSFDEVQPATRYEQEMVELPHEYMRTPEIMSKYFLIERLLPRARRSRPSVVGEGEGPGI